MTQAYFTPATAADVVGQTFTSGWHEIDQASIQTFGQVTKDPDPHHVDPEFCKDNSPWGAPIAFGFQTVAMITPMLYEVYRYPLDGDPADGYPASFGANRLRLISPVKAGSRIRGHFNVADVTDRKPGQMQLTFDITVEIEGEERPALQAQWLMLWITPQADAAAA